MHQQETLVLECLDIPWPFPLFQQTSAAAWTACVRHWGPRSPAESHTSLLAPTAGDADASRRRSARSSNPKYPVESARFNSKQSHFKDTLYSLFVIVYVVLTHSDDTLLLHPARGVMELHKLHRHLVVDGQQELLPRFKLQLKLSALFVRQFWGSWWKQRTCQ